MPIEPEAQRPDPDVLLEEAGMELHRGKLKIFFGACAGVGKTYAMLQEARRLHAQGADVVIGVVETHGRSETADLVAGLPWLALKSINYRRRTYQEFDVDAVLARTPALVLVDELAHSNVQGSRHTKRWQDVEELLDAGIDVWTTLNVQHLESLNDVVGSVTGIQVRETIPDRIFDSAQEVVLVDIPPDDLRQRLHEGKIYLPHQAARAINHFFRKENLTALRELALRCTADRVDDQVQAMRRQGEPVWHTRDAILVCIGPGGGNDKLVRVAARLANKLGCIWHAIYVETPQLYRLPEQERRTILRTLHLAQTLGAETATLPAQDRIDAILYYARTHNLGKIVLGRYHQSGRLDGLFRSFRHEDSLARQLGRRGIDLDVLLISLSPEMDKIQDTLPPDLRHQEENRRRQAQGSLAAVVSCAAITLLAVLVAERLATPNLIMLYLLGVVLVALRYGRLSASIAAVINVASFDFFFVTPHFSFAVSDMQYLLTFGIMLAVGLLIGQLTAWARYQARIARYREERTQHLFEMSKALSATHDLKHITSVVSHFLSRSFRAKTALLTLNGEGKLESLGPNRWTGDFAIATWVLEHQSPAGMGTQTLPATTQRYIPVITGRQVYAVLVLEPANSRLLMIPEQQRLLETYVLLIATTLERLHLTQETAAVKLERESEQLRNTLLSALSHDLRTPLTVLFTQAEHLLHQLGKDPNAHACIPAAQAIQHKTRDTIRLVNNMLDMARIQSNQLTPNREWQSLQEMVGSALSSLQPWIQQHPLSINIPDDFPLLYCDGMLMQRVFVNLLDNSCKYAGEGATIGIHASVIGTKDIQITLWNNGPALPPAQLTGIFQKFARGDKESAIPGVGLGLAICQTIVQSHQGRIWAENRRDQGVNFCFTLPYVPLPALEPELDTHD